MTTLRIGYYKLLINPKRGVPQTEMDNLDVYNELVSVINYVISKNKIERKIEDDDVKIFYFLDEFLNNILIFEYDRYNNVHKLRHKDTFNERIDSKSPEEGDEVKTHAGIKRTDREEVALLLEEKRLGCRISSVVHYLNEFLKRKYAESGTNLKFSFNYVYELDDTFREQIKNGKIKGVTISVIDYELSRQLSSTSGFFKYSRRNQAIMEVRLNLKAKRKMNLPNTIKNVILGRPNDRIKVENVTIKNAQGYNQIIKPDIFKKIKKIKELPNETNLNDVKYEDVMRELKTALGELDG